MKGIREIAAVFKDGYEGHYTEAILELLKTDPDVKYIYSLDTGVVIFDRG